MSTKKSMPTGGFLEDLIVADDGIPEQPIVENLFYPGINLLFGPPKAGKSNFAFQVAGAVANGIPLFGAATGFDVVKGRILYLALEETPKLVLGRIRKMGISFPPKSLQLKTSFRTLDKGAVTKIGNAIKNDSTLRLVVIDVYQKIKGNMKGGGYASEYKNLAALKKLADDNNVAIVLLHHTTKKIPKNWQAAAYGSQGLTGAVDTTILLDRPDMSSKGRLCVTGRKCRTAEYVTEFDDTNLQWQIVGEVKDTSLTEERRDILETLKDECGGFLAPKEIGTATGLDSKSVHNILMKLEKISFVDKVKRGCYRITLLGLQALED
ncbi:AAA family ATPase [Maridesulfovibrio sp.]|uniref:AAA family ATPase n=1 Tax=Maridesulfovibrio sp. TaxID=2795000 RepID=UPI0029C9CB68|nr:AAA family ATPase [Maridesulfovibrio sp.]